MAETEDVEKIEGSESYLAGRIQALLDVQESLIALIKPYIANDATSPGGAGIKIMIKGEDALEYEARKYQDEEAFGKGYTEEFNKAEEVFRSL